MDKNKVRNGLMEQNLLKPLCAAALLCSCLVVYPIPAVAASTPGIAADAAQITVKGTVIDAQGEPIIGASIVQVGTTNGTVTDFDGNFTLNVPQDATLEISYIGYVSQRVKASPKLRIVLKEDTKALEEVVVIGYGTARKSDVTGSIASVNNKTLKEVPSSNFTQAIQGRVAGVDIQRTSSRPGSEQQVRIRGTRSLNASNDPLIVLDGIPFAGSISDINPNDIKSMDILKDASATAIYGSRGANGVIIITTNRGATGKATVNYNGYVGAVTLFSKFPMMNASQFQVMREVAGKNGSAWAVNGPMDESNVDTDWQDEVFQTGFTTSHDISIAGGTDRGSYNFGTSYYKETAVVPNQSFERFSVRGSFDQEIGKILKVGITTQTSYSKTNGENSSPIYNVLQTNPTISPYDQDGNLRQVLDLNSSDKLINPLYYDGCDDDTHKDLRKTLATYNSAYAEIKILDGLKYRLNLGLNYRHSDYGLFNAPGSPYMGYNETLATAETSNHTTTNWTVENLLSYDKDFGKHHLNVVAMYSAEQTEYQLQKQTASGITANEVQFYNLGLNTVSANINPNDQNYYKRGLMSWMGRVQWQYDNRYMAAFTLRSDGSSVLAKGHQWHTYPAASIGWNMKNESFLKENTDWLNQLKLRIGYGETSNQSIDPYTTLGSMKPVYYTAGGIILTGYNPYSVPNANLGWEYSSTWNFGVDFGFLNGRISGSFEYYIQKTKDILMAVNLPASSGIQSSYMQNIGATQNKGWELSLRAAILEDHNGWSWNVGFNLYANRNKITELAGEQKRDPSNYWFVGEPIDAIYDYKKLGIYQKGEEAIAAAAHSGGKPGDIKVAYNPEFGGEVTFDANGVPSREINSNDRMVIGSPEADWQGGFNTDVSYKNWDFSIVGAFRHGGLLISTLHSGQGYLNMLSGRRGNINVNYWTEDNPTNDYPTPGGTQGGSDAPIYSSTLAYFSASYLKIRTITLGYTFPEKWMKPLGISRARIYGTVSNPFVFFSPFNDETDMDPEPNSTVQENSATSGSMPKRLLSIGTNSPSTRSFILGVNVTF